MRVPPKDGRFAAEIPQNHLPLLPSNPEPHASPKINWQCRIARHFVIPSVQGILHIHVSSNVRAHCIPSSQICAHVPRRVIYAKSQKIRIRPPPYKTSAQASSPSCP